MKKNTMIIAVLVLAMIASMFVGCAEKEPEPLRICMDVEHANMISTDNVELMIYELQNTLNQSGGLTDYEIECIPREGAERESALKRIRAELMAGKGPDVFIVKCHSDTSLSEPLFTVPEKIMANDFFLPLDEYIENDTQFTEWDKLTKAVMDAGRDEEGQQIIPLAYTMPILYLADAGTPKDVSASMTWSEMLEDENLSLEAKLLSDLSVFTTETELAGVGLTDALDFVLGTPADYEAEELAFTEEELKQIVETMLKFSANAQSAGYEEVPLHCENILSVSQQEIKRTLGTEAQEMMSLCSVDGGYTALITSFAAVNRNTERPEDAFKVIDLLLRTNVQQNYRIYNELFLWGSFPMHEELLQSDYPTGILDDTVGEEQFAEICEVRETITSAHFQGTLGTELMKMLYECELAFENGESIDEIISEAYGKMKRILSE